MDLAKEDWNDRVRYIIIDVGKLRSQLEDSLNRPNRLPRNVEAVQKLKNKLLASTIYKDLFSSR